jgi:SAM-dependent methyltransferase
MLSVNQFDILHAKMDFNQFSPFILNALDRLDKNWRSKPILEIGCGQGGHAKFFEHSQSLGIDISKVAIAKAQRNYPQKKFKVANILVDEFDYPFEYIIDSKLINSLDASSLELYLNNIMHFRCIVAEIAIHPSICFTKSERYFYTSAFIESLISKKFKYSSLSLIPDHSFQTSGLDQEIPVYLLLASNQKLF